MEILLVIIMIVAVSCQSGFCSMFGKHYPGNKDLSSQIFSIFFGLIVSVATLAVAGFAFDPSATTWVFGIVTGIVLVAYNSFLLMAANRGPYSIVMLFCLSGDILIPLIFSMILSGTRLNLIQIISIAAMLVSFVLINKEPKKKLGEEKEKTSGVFLLFAVLLGCVNGAYGTLMNRQQELVGTAENAEMIIITYAVSAVAAFIVLLVTTKKECFKAFKLNTKSTVFVILAGCCATLFINMMMYLLSIMNVAVLYTLGNGGSLLISVFWSVIFYKEKLNPTKIIGLILATVSFIALSVF